MPHLYGKLTCHMGSHSVTCHLAEVKNPPLPPAEAGTWFDNSGGCKAELTYVTWKRTSRKLNPQPVSRKPNALSLSQHATLHKCIVTASLFP